MSDPTCVSLFSGIGGLDEGLRRAGFRHLAFCEQDAYRRDVLRARFPGVPIYDDVRDIGGPAQPREQPEFQYGGTEARRRPQPSLDLVCGGFPCQDLSVAGQRKGLDGSRSGLFFEFARIADLVRPRWLLVENVPGLLTSQGGRDFGTVLGTLADIGYGLAWRVLDSRFFGVPQRRRRVFILGALADGDPRAAAERAGEVLAVGTRCQGHPPTRGETREDAAESSPDGAGGGGSVGPAGSGLRNERETAFAGDDHGEGQAIAGTLGGGSGSRGWAQDTERMTFIASTLHSTQRGVPNAEQAAGNHIVAPALSATLGSPRGHDEQASYVSVGDVGVVSPEDDGDEGLWISEFELTGFRERSIGVSERVDLAAFDTHAVDEVGHNSDCPKPASAVKGLMVRRLTPTECERLQALSDGWTDLGGTADSKRYAALGDAVTASVAEWIGHRLRRADSYWSTRPHA